MTNLDIFSIGFGIGFCTALTYAWYEVRRQVKAIEKKRK
jgi:hypothetical protein